MPVPYLIANPPRIRQFRAPRRATPTGLIVVHTAESAPDEHGPDDGTTNVARFIRDRTTYGSYHWIADSDSRLQLVPHNAEAYGDGTGSNPFAIHISAATQAARWPTLSPEWRAGCVRQLAEAAADAARWLKAEHGITVPAVRVNRTQSDQGRPGFISHGERDPGRRTDPGATFPWAVFLDHFRTITQEDDMPNYRDWDKADREALASDVAGALLDQQTVKLRKRDGSTKDIPVRAALQRILNPDES